MNINFNHIFNYTVPSLFKERILPALTAQQKKILAIVSVCLGFVAACYLASRCCLKNRASIIADNADGLQPVQMNGATEPYPPLDEAKIIQEAEKQFANNPHKDKIISKIKDHLKGYQSCGRITSAEGALLHKFSSDAEKQEFEMIKQAEKDFLGRQDLFKGISVMIID